MRVAACVSGFDCDSSVTGDDRGFFARGSGDCVGESTETIHGPFAFDSVISASAAVELSVWDVFRLPNSLLSMLMNPVPFLLVPTAAATGEQGLRTSLK